ncbi:hypothetical protein Cus16_3126 [Curtobacterium sp. ER1/6]|nr:hypothetical protein Cus16_3126 [Curtobacterium sp. ER1/6]
MRIASSWRSTGSSVRAWPASRSSCSIARASATSSAPPGSALEAAARASSVIVGSQVREALLGPVLGGPPECQLPQRFELFERDRRVPVQLEDRQEASHHDTRLRDTGDQLAERDVLVRTGPEDGHDDRGLLADAHERRVQVLESDGRDLPRGERERRDRREVLHGQGPHELGRPRAEALLEPHPADVAAGFLLPLLPEPLGGLLERPVLQEPGEQQVAGLEQGDVLGVDEFTLRQEPGDLQVEQGRGDDEELAGLVELVGGLRLAHVLDELTGDGAERHLGDVELVLRDQRQQQVERAVEVAQPDPEAGRRGRVRRRRHARRAPWRAPGRRAPRRARVPSA